MHPLDQLGALNRGPGIAARSFADVRAQASARPQFGRAKPPFSLVVDLGEHVFSRQWWRGAATLVGLCGLAASIAPDPLGRLAASNATQVDEQAAAEYRALGIAPIEQGSSTGGRMASTALVEPLTHAPERARIELYATLGSGDSLDKLLVRNGTPYADAIAAARMVATAGGRIEPGTSIAIVLGRRGGDGSRPLQELSLKAGMDKVLTITSGAGGLNLSVARLAVDNSPLRIRGQVGSGLYWSLRSAGVSATAASEYLRALSGRLDVGADVSPADRFDLIVANRKSAGGSQEGPLLYAALERFGGKQVRLMKWSVGSRQEWIDPDAIGQQVSTFAWPVHAPITSTFGMRVHPILRFARMHRGIDFGAASGTPILATADGQVFQAGWAGGYGRQVRIAHSGGLATSYSHMSRMVVEPGTFVRQGQLIGYVGSSGLSTGPHLHYEVYRGGVAVNPMGVRFSNRALLEGDHLAAFKARLSQLTAVRAKG